MMTNIRQFPQRLEITFWQALIAVMSDAPELSRLILKTQHLIAAMQPAHLLLWASICSLSGLVLGFILGAFSQLVNLP
jgi:hypothetical protein